MWINLSLEKKKKKSVSFKIDKSFARHPGHITVHEKDDEGVIKKSYTIPPEKVEDIDTWTHEFSEAAIMDVTGPGEKGHITRYKKEDDELKKYEISVPHLAVSHHTMSGIDTEELTPVQFEKWVWDPGRLEKIYPMMEQIRIKWTQKIDMAKRATKESEFREALKEMRMVKDSSVGKIPPAILNHMQKQIQKVAEKLR